MSERGSIWGLRLLAVLLAVVAWFLATTDRREDRTDLISLDASITYTTPERMMILDPVEEVRLGIRGTASQIQNLGRFQVSVSVDLRQAEKGAVEVNLSQRDVLLPEGMVVDSIEPNQFVVELDRVVKEIRRVEPNLVGEPAAGAAIISSEVVPPQVLISGPESRVGALQSLVTSPVSLDGHAFPFDQRAQVVSPDATIQVVQDVLVTVRVVLEVPTVGNNREPDDSGSL